jgi:hypothetical protein
VQQDLIFTVVNKKKTWKDRYRDKHLYRGEQEKDLERSLPWKTRSAEIDTVVNKI